LETPKNKCNHENTKATKEHEEDRIFFVCFFVLSCLRGPCGKQFRRRARHRL